MGLSGGVSCPWHTVGVLLGVTPLPPSWATRGTARQFCWSLLVPLTTICLVAGGFHLGRKLA